MADVYYRYDERVHLWWDDEYERITGRVVDIALRTLPVIKRTPKGVWLINYGSRKFVLNDSRKRFACPTREEALDSFIARKQRQAGILRAQLDTVDRALSLAVSERDKTCGVFP